MYLLIRSLCLRNKTLLQAFYHLSPQNKPEVGRVCAVPFSSKDNAARAEASCWVCEHGVTEAAITPMPPRAQTGPSKRLGFAPRSQELGRRCFCWDSQASPASTAVLLASFPAGWAPQAPPSHPAAVSSTPQS